MSDSRDAAGGAEALAKSYADREAALKAAAELGQQILSAEAGLDPEVVREVQAAAGVESGDTFAKAAVADTLGSDLIKIDKVAKVLGRCSGGDIKSFLEQAEDAAHIFQVDLSALPGVVSLLLEGEARAYWQGRKQQLQQPISWEVTCSELRRRFPSEGKPFREPRKELFSIELVGVAVASYVSRFTQLLAECQPAVGSADALEVFLKGLPDDVRGEVERVRPAEGWDPISAMPTVQRELLRLFDSGELHRLTGVRKATSGVRADSAGSNGSDSSKGKGKRFQPAKRPPSALGQAGPSQPSAKRQRAGYPSPTEVQRCMKERLCFYCKEPLASLPATHRGSACPAHPKHGSKN